MDNTGINPNVIQQICHLAQKNGIATVYLFGSRARGDWRRESDIDLAIIGGDANTFHFDLENNTDTLLTFDVVNAEHIDGDFLDTIKKEGKCIYEKI